MEENNCIFCKIASGEIKSQKIYEDDNFFAVYDINPETEGHALVITKKHFKTLLDVPSSLGNELLEAIKKTSFLLIEKHKAEGFNIVFNVNECSGQIVHHVHAHIIPRKANDNMHCTMKNGLRELNHKK
ncbi:MAG: HIT family protein [Candidatus Nanoarchaeia archaeon]